MSHRLAINIFFFTNGFLFANWAARIPRLQEDYGMDNRALGFILLAHSVGAFIAMPVSGWMIAKNGSRRITAISGILFCLFFITIPLTGTYWTLMIPFFFMGASTGVMDVAMNAQAVVVEAEMGRPIMTFFHGLFSIGMVVGGLSGAFFTSIDWTLGPHFAITGFAGLVLILVFGLKLHPDLQSKENLVDQWLIWPRGTILILGAIAFCCMIGEGAMSDWSANYLRNIMGASEAKAAFGLTAFAFFMTVGRLVGDGARMRFGDRSLLRICAVVSLIGITLILIRWNMTISIIGFGVVGLGLSIIVPIIYSLSGRYPGLSPGVGIAMSTTVGYAGFMIGPPIIGFIADATDIAMALSFIGLLFILMTFMIFKLKSL